MGFCDGSGGCWSGDRSADGGQCHRGHPSEATGVYQPGPPSLCLSRALKAFVILFILLGMSSLAGLLMWPSHVEASFRCGFWDVGHRTDVRLVKSGRKQFLLPGLFTGKCLCLPAGGPDDSP